MSAYDENVGAAVVDCDVGLEDVEVKGGRDEASVACPFLTSSNQQAVTKPTQQKSIATKRLCLWL